MDESEEDSEESLNSNRIYECCVVCGISLKQTEDEYALCGLCERCFNSE